MPRDEGQHKNGIGCLSIKIYFKAVFKKGSKEGEDSEEEVEHSRNSTQPSPAFKPHRVGGAKHE